MGRALAALISPPIGHVESTSGGAHAAECFYPSRSTRGLMGDARFDPPLARLRAASDRASALAALNDEEVLQALAASSKFDDAYLANVLATEALNRHRRLVARVWAAGVAYLLVLAVACLGVLLAAVSGAGIEPHEASFVWIALLAPPLAGGAAAYVWRLRAALARGRG